MGQCGNQVGNSFFEQLIENISDDNCSSFIREKVVSTFFERTQGGLKAKAILLDMEPKVVQKCLNSASFYDP